MRRLFVPEVVQTSAMDCGPACLKSLIDGFRGVVSYGRLREACQTDVDGTSIDTIEEIAQKLGLDCEQVVVPPDHVVLDQAEAMPCVAVVLTPSGLPHFIVVWRCHGPLVQIMDPAIGRRWIPRRQLTRELYIHEMELAAEDWREWATTDNFIGPLRQRLRRLGVVHTALVETALADESWLGLACLDAAIRLTASLLDAGAVGRGSGAGRMLGALVDDARQAPDPHAIIPKDYWSALPADPDEDGAPQVRARGAILVRAEAYATPAAAEQSPELSAALSEPPARPGRELARIVRDTGRLAPLALVLGLLVAALGLVVEAVLFRGLFDLGRSLGLVEQRLGAILLIIAFMAALLFIEFPIAVGVQRMGRQIETRLRLSFLIKLPRIAVRYFRSRPTSDMAERSHNIHQLRLLPPLAGTAVRSLFEIILTTAGLIWLAPSSAPIAVGLAAAACLPPLLMQGPLGERDLRVRTHGGALTHFYLDALQGIMAVRTHGIERPIRREQEALLVQWVEAGLASLRAAALFEAAQSVITLALAAWLVLDYLIGAGEPAGALLLVYWALTLPPLGQQLASAARAYPRQRNLTLRLLEPLGAVENTEAEAPAPPPDGRSGGVCIELDRVTVHAAGNTLLDDVTLTIQPGSHIAVVGRSGAGKSSLCGLLLGWHGPTRGTLRIDGVPLSAASLARLRQETAWLDPAVQIWNRTLAENLRYGYVGDPPLSLVDISAAADLPQLLPRLPDGLQTVLGESGKLVSGGEGQRVRLGRAMHRPDARLVILDEPFRGLDRDQRRDLLNRTRAYWPHATIICVTHGLAETLEFERVLVVNDGKIAEDGDPPSLAVDENSQYRAMLDAERGNDDLWRDPVWRHLRMDKGRLMEDSG